MSRLSLNDWYRYLESQFVEEERAAREEPPPIPPAEPKPEGEVSAEPESLTPPEITGEVKREVHGAYSQEVSGSETRPALFAAREAYALVSIRVPDFLAFVPLLREELGLPAPPSDKMSEPQSPSLAVVETRSSSEPAARLRKHRPKKTPDPEQLIPPEMDEIWAKLPRYLRYLAEWSDDSVTDKYYPVRGRESREELIARLTDPVLSLEEVARLLGVCPATVRRYTNRGWLRHFRTEGNQRRFRLSDIVAFLEEQIKRVPQSGRHARSARAQQGQSRRS
ncbi:MAG: helix-turn-helix domain-containing protein [Fimbriimonadales bacterium]|nr:helix-turn-helix domain-containing protein [Fimbriimonadales bacterium]